MFYARNICGLESFLTNATSRGGGKLARYWRGSWISSHRVLSNQLRKTVSNNKYNGNYEMMLIQECLCACEAHKNHMHLGKKIQYYVSQVPNIGNDLFSNLNYVHRSALITNGAPLGAEKNNLTGSPMAAEEHVEHSEREEDGEVDPQGAGGRSQRGWR